MTGEHVDSHPTVASGSCYTGSATAAGSSAGLRPRRRASFHGTPPSSPEKGRTRRASFHGTPGPASPEKGRSRRASFHGTPPSPPEKGLKARPRGAPLRPEDVMAQALQREMLTHQPPSRDLLPSRSASWRTEPQDAQGWVAPREHPRRSQSMHPSGGGATQQMSMQRLQHVLAPAPPAHAGGAPPVRSQTWQPSAATRPEDLAAEKERRGANLAATLCDLTCSPRAIVVFHICICIHICIYAQMMQQQFNHDVFVAEQDLAAEAQGGVNMTRIEALRLKMQRWQLSPTSLVRVAAYPNLNPNLHPSPNTNPNQVAGHLRAPTGRATIRSGHGRISGVPTAPPPTLPLALTSTRTRTLAGTNPSRCTSGWWHSSAMLWTSGRPLRTWSKGLKPRCTSCSR